METQKQKPAGKSTKGTVFLAVKLTVKFFLVTVAFTAAIVLAFFGYSAVKRQQFAKTVENWSKHEPESGEKYRLLEPDRNMYPEENYALIVWLHGAGESGKDNVRQLQAEPLKNMEKDEIQSMFNGVYVCATQADRVHDCEKIMRSIEDVLENHKDIDRSRIYIGGVSQGGLYTYAMALRYPDFFAAAFPVAAPAIVEEQEICLEVGDKAEYRGDAGALRDLPVYLVHCVKDESVSAACSVDMYRLLREEGNENVHLTLFDSTGNDQQVLAPHDMAENVLMNFPTSDGTGGFVENFFEGDSLKVIKAWVGNHEPDEEIENVVSELPPDFGYETFFEWLAAQKK